MSQRKLTTIESLGGGLALVRKLAKKRGVHLLRLTEDQGNELVAASTIDSRSFVSFDSGCRPKRSWSAGRARIHHRSSPRWRTGSSRFGRSRLLLNGLSFLYFRVVMSDRTSNSRTGDAMMSCDVTCYASYGRAFDTAMRMGRRCCYERGKHQGHHPHILPHRLLLESAVIVQYTSGWCNWLSFILAREWWSHMAA